MRYGFLSQHFVSVAVKDLTAVEADSEVSNQHEFHGIAALRAMFGELRQTFRTEFLYMSDDEDEIVSEDGFLTWYNSRHGKPRSPEYRLYFKATAVSLRMRAGDTLLIAMRPDQSILAIVLAQGSTIRNQVMWLFGFRQQDYERFHVNEKLVGEKYRIRFATTMILELIGVPVHLAEEDFLDDMLVRFKRQFPSTKEFSEYARSTLPEVSSTDDPDAALMEWIEREETLFRTLERFFVRERLAQGFSDNVDEFVRYSLSVHNRRKSRAGHALENHVETILKEHGVRYLRSAETENRSRPDFLFPGESEYHDMNFNAQYLTMLGVKSTCKDRWRQVLAEADRIDQKHLLTLEPAISEHQTTEMMNRGLRLVLPVGLHYTYSDQQKPWLMQVKEFIELVVDRQLYIDSLM